MASLARLMNVADAVLTATAGPAITGVAGQQITNVPVASFTEGDPIGEYTATINWGDNTTSLGTIQANGDGAFGVTGTHTYLAPGNYTFTVTIRDRAGSSAAVAGPAAISAPLIRIAPSSIAVGSDAGLPAEVKVYNAQNGALKFDLQPSGGFTGGARVAIGDVNGDGTPDIVVGAGPGGGPQVRVFDGRTGQPLAGPLGSFYGILPGTFTGGVFVAAGDVDGDGFADVIVGADAGGGPQVNVFSGRTGALLHSFRALAPGFTGGVRVGAADLDGDGRADIIVGAGPGGLPQVTVYRGSDLAVLTSFWAFPLSFPGGVYLTGAPATGNGLAAVVVGGALAAARRSTSIAGMARC